MIQALIFVLVAATSIAAEYTIPADRRTNWTPATYVGCPGGIPTSFPLTLNVTASPYFAAGTIATTTGSITSGTNSLVVADASTFAIGQNLIAGYTEIQSLLITGGATSTGNIAVTIGLDDNPSNDKGPTVAVVSGDTAAQIGDKIRAASVSFPGWTLGGAGATVTLTTNDPVSVATVVSVDGSGVTGTGSVTQNGSRVVSTSITNKVGSTLTLTANASGTISSGLVIHNDSPAIQDAVNAAAFAAQPTTVYIPAGTYYINTQISLGHSGTQSSRIKGDGDTTIIHLASLASGFFYGGSGNAEGTTHTITAGLTRDSQTLTISDTTNYSVGDLILVQVDNDITLPTASLLGVTAKIRNQYTRVTGKTGTTLSIFPPLYDDYTIGATTQLYTQVITDTGVEDLYIEAENSNGQYICYFEQAWNCWFKGVKIHLAHNYGFYLSKVVNCEMRKCYLDGLNHVGNNGAGLLAGVMSGTLVEDNIFYDAFPHLEINSSSCGNVIAYNFCQYNYANGIMGASIDANHGAHNSLNLYEGNISSKFQSDGYYGSASQDTVFRNWLHATCNDQSPSTDEFGIAVFLNRMSRKYNIIGNILGRAGESNQMYINVGPGNNADGTSTTSHTIGTGSKVFTTQAGLVMSGNDVKIWSDANNDNFMIGTVTGYTGTTLTVSIYRSNGSGTHTDWTFRGARGTGYSERYMLSLGLPNLGNGSYADMAELSEGTAHAWVEWIPYLANSNTNNGLPKDGSNYYVGFQEYDWDVWNTILLKGNYNYATVGIPAAESLGGDTLPNSLYRAAKPDWFGSINWPAFDAASPGTPAYTQIPAGWRYVNNNENYLDGGNNLTVAGTATVTGLLTLPP